MKIRTTSKFLVAVSIGFIGSAGFLSKDRNQAVLLLVCGILALLVSSYTVRLTETMVIVRGSIGLPAVSYHYSDLRAVEVRTTSVFESGLGLHFGRRKTYFVVRSGPVVVLGTKRGREIYVNCGSKAQCADMARAIAEHLVA